MAAVWREQVEPGQRPPLGALALGATGPILLIGLGVMLYNDLREKIVLPDDSYIFTESSEVWVLTYRYVIYLPTLFRQ